MTKITSVMKVPRLRQDGDDDDCWPSDGQKPVGHWQLLLVPNTNPTTIPVLTLAPPHAELTEVVARELVFAVTSPTTDEEDVEELAIVISSFPLNEVTSGGPQSILSSQCHTFFFRAADACSAKYHVSHFRDHSNNDPLHGRAIAVKSTKV